MTFQLMVLKWMRTCFGSTEARNVQERGFRFVEEALELAQANGMVKEEVLQLVDYVFERPPGNIEKEIGDVMVTLAGVANANHCDMFIQGHHVLEENWRKLKAIQAKQASKVKGSPLPGGQEDG